MKKVIFILFIVLPMIVMSQVMDPWGPNWVRKKDDQQDSRTSMERIITEVGVLQMLGVKIKDHINEKQYAEIQDAFNKIIELLARENVKDVLAELKKILDLLEKEPGLSQSPEFDQFKNNVTNLIGWMEWNYDLGVEPPPPPLPPVGDKLTNAKIEFFNSGLIDHFLNGEMIGSARFLSLYIGSKLKNKWVPLYVYGSASGNGIQNEKQEENDNVYTNLLNPLGGIFNIFISKHPDFTENTESYFGIGPTGQIGFKSINSVDLLTNNKFNLDSFYGIVGLLCTFDLKEQKENNFGYAYLHPAIMASLSSKSDMERSFSLYDKKWLFGYSVEFGLFLPRSINIRGGYYRYLFKKEITDILNFDYLKKGVWKVGIDYNLGL